MQSRTPPSTAIAARKRARRAHQRFEFGRRLPFVALFKAHAEQRGSGVEQTAGARRCRHDEAIAQEAGELGRRGNAGEFLRRLVEPPERMQRGKAHPPGAARGAIAARQREWCEATESPPRCAADQHDFAAPGRAVVAMSVPIERDAEDWSGHAVLGRDRRDMRGVMLDAHHRQSRLLGPARRMEIGMQVAGDCLRLDIENVEKMADRLGMEADRRRIVEAADMLGDEGLAPARHRDGRLEMRADREHARPVAAEIDRLRHEAARAPQERRRAVEDGHNRIVGASHNRAVMRDDEVGDACKLCLRLVVADDERLAAGIGAGRDQHEIVGRMPGGWSIGDPAAT